MAEVENTMEEFSNFRKCIICSNNTNENKSYNIFTTTLPKGNQLLSDFVKDILGCSVLIVVVPEFFLCKRCFLLCSKLDRFRSHCTQLENCIKTLFMNTNKTDVDSCKEKSTFADKEGSCSNETDDVPVIENNLDHEVTEDGVNHSCEGIHTTTKKTDEMYSLLVSELVEEEVTLTSSLTENTTESNHWKTDVTSCVRDGTSSMRGNYGPQRRNTITDAKGFMYCVNRTFGQNRYLRCTKYKKGCFARAILRSGNEVEVQRNHFHNHPPDPRRVAVRKFTEAMITEAQNRLGRRLIDVYNQVAMRYPEEAAYVTFQTAKRAVKRAQLVDAMCL